MCDFQINGVLVTKLRVVDLKEELESRGLSKSGKKDELIARLVSYLEANPEEGAGNAGDAISEATEDGNSHDEMMRKWQEEREQLLRENEERRAAEERKVKEEEEEKSKQEEETKAKAKAKEEQQRLAREAEEKRKLNEEKEKRRKEEEEKVIKQEEEAKRQKEADRLKKEKEKEKQKQLLKEEEERKSREAEEKRRKEEDIRRIKENKEKAEKEKLEKEKATAAAAEVKETPAGGGKMVETPVKDREDETLILETAADDTLVMEIDQADLVSEEPPKEEKEDLISAEPGQVTSLRKLGGSKADTKDQRKRGWGASKSRDDSASTVSISSNSLKDIVPDIAPLMDSTEPIMEQEEGETNSIESDPDVAGPKIPTAIKKEEPTKKKKRITLTDEDNETNFLLITNLTRPFTVNALKEMLKRTGTIQEFWIDRIKSTCCVKFDTADQASETRMALNGVAWPVGNPKSLKVAFTSEEEMKKYQEASAEVGTKAGGQVGDRLTGVREWDRNKMSEDSADRDGKREREVKKSEREVRIRERSSDRKTPLVPMKNLEDLFKKTTASPAIYWRPLTDQDIQRRIELRNKKMTEEKIRREMEDTKETLQKSNKLISSGSPP